MLCGVCAKVAHKKKMKNILKKLDGLLRRRKGRFLKRAADDGIGREVAKSAAWTKEMQQE